jgi:hypothetical protein
MKHQVLKLIFGVSLAVATSGIASATTAYDNYTNLNGGGGVSLSGFNSCTTTANGSTSTGCPVKISGASAFYFGTNTTTAETGASIGAYSGYGLGICSAGDSSFTGGTTTGTCSSSDGQHQIDNKNGYEALLITFSAAVNISSFNLAVFNISGTASANADLTYWTNPVTITGSTTISSLGTGTSVNAAGLGTCNPCTVNDAITANGVTSILIMASTTDGKVDGFKLSDIGLNAVTSATPEPASMVMLGSGLLACAAMLRRRMSQK